MSHKDISTRKSYRNDELSAIYIPKKLRKMVRSVDFIQTLTQTNDTNVDYHQSYELRLNPSYHFTADIVRNHLGIPYVVCQDCNSVTVDTKKDVKYVLEHWVNGNILS